jgi:hypothetical protein
LTSYSYASPLNGTSLRATETRTQLNTFARVLDSALCVPGTTIRFGADVLLNLIPGVRVRTSKWVSTSRSVRFRWSAGLAMCSFARTCATWRCCVTISTEPIRGRTAFRDDTTQEEGRVLLLPLYPSQDSAVQKALR